MNFKEFLTRCNVPFVESGSARCRPGWIQLDCPRCSRPESRWHMGYNLARRYLHCWSCGPKDLAATLNEITAIPVAECRKVIGDLDYDRTLVVEAPRGRLSLPKGVEPLMAPHRRYLIARGFDPDELVKLWGLQATGAVSTHPWRIFIPIHYGGEVVSWTTRSLADSDHLGRYRSARLSEEKVPHKHLLYGEEWCEHTVIVCEGPTDVWKIGPGAVATMGTSYTKPQILKMSKYARRVILFDNEKAAQRRARNLADALASLDGETILARLDAPDPGAASDEEIKEIRKAFLEDR